MDFFGAQARARQQSRLLGWGFALVVAMVIFLLNLIVLSVLRVAYAAKDHPEPFGGSLAEWATAHPGTVLLTSLVVGGFIGIASLTRMLQLREGGGYVARSVGGVRVERGTPDPRRRMLHNIVDEMALAAGIPAPEVYVLEKNDSINAFAAGHTPANAAVAVTRGALLKLNRDQLQGVIAHEYSHILNGDIRISIRLMGLVFGLMAISLAGRTMFRLAGHSNRGAVPLLVVGLGVAVIGQIGFWGGRILQAWISRQRECLADASAVQFTRNPDGLRDALVRAAALSPPRLSGASGLEQVAHMLFVTATPRLLATHPPLLQRLRALDPHFTQAQLESMIRRAQSQWREAGPPEESLISAAVPAEWNDHGATLVSAAAPAEAERIAGTAGNPGPGHLAYAVALRHSLPQELRASASAPEQARILLLALLAQAEPSSREAQLKLVATQLGVRAADAVQQAVKQVRLLSALHRLPAVLQLFPSLRGLPDTDRVVLAGLLGEMIRIDTRISVFEYSLEKLALRALDTRAALNAPHGRQTLADRSGELGVVFAVLARHGARTDEQARHAYEAGIAALLPRQRPAYSVIENWVPAFDQSLDALRALRATAKQLVVEALVRTIAHDALLTPEEAELLRAVCAVLECPLPPVLPAA
jgi:Zn-dependent protease with chaperone function